MKRETEVEPERGELGEEGVKGTCTKGLAEG